MELQKKDEDINEKHSGKLISCLLALHLKSPKSWTKESILVTSTTGDKKFKQSFRITRRRIKIWKLN